MRIALLVLLALLLAETVHAQIEFFGQFRHRSELDARRFTDDVASPSDPLAYHLLRTRLGVRAQPAEDVRVVVQVQDSRFFGAGNPGLGRGTLDARAGLLDFHEAYLALDDLFDTGLGLRLGRQELAYGNERLVGALGWNNVGRSFDAAVLRYAGPRVQADVFAAQLVSRAVHEASQHFAGVYATASLAEGHALDAFVLLDTDYREVAAGPDAGEPSLVRWTPGARLYGRTGALDYDLEAAAQLGRADRGSARERESIRASLLSAELGYTPAPRLRLGAGYTRLSGESVPVGTVGTFNTLFATNHKFYGFMDYFPALGGSYGLQNAYLTLRAPATEHLGLRLDLHHFAAAASPNGLSGVFGQEVDAVATYRYSPALGFELGASAFVPGGFVSELFREEGPRFWFYLQTQVRF